MTIETRSSRAPWCGLRRAGCAKIALRTPHSALRLPVCVSSLHTACVLWSEKTTVCRIFSCQRSLGASPRTPRGRSLGPGPRSAPAARSVPLAGTFYSTPTDRRSQPERHESAARRGSGAPAEREAGGLTKLNKVENTGLEPVTSWLQTRRSPS